MKKLPLCIFLVLMWCNIGFAEIYACSGDLTRYDRPGEIENKIYKRDGNFFYNHMDWKFLINFENDKQIHLIKESSGSSIFTVIIDKKTKEFTESFFSVDDARKNKKTPLMYGKCVRG